MVSSGASLRFKIYLLIFLIVLGVCSYTMRNASPKSTQTQDVESSITISEQKFNYSDDRGGN